MKAPPTLYRGAALIDAATTWIVGDAALLVLDGEVIAAGRCGEVERHPAATNSHRVDLSDHLLLPGMVNAHAHLDLTSLGPRAYDREAGFVAWVDMIRSARPVTETDIRRSVERGIELALAGGTCIIGDVAGQGSRLPLELLRRSPLGGVSFVEIFGLGRNQTAATDYMDALVREFGQDPGAVRFGLQPHAPYSAGLDVYEAAAAHGCPVCTHLAETPEERQFVMQGDGPMRDLVQRLGKWDDSILRGSGAVGQGLHPIDHLRAALTTAPWIAAHVNDLGDEGSAETRIALLLECNVSVAYCPRASTYFRRERDFGPHRYRDLLSAGVNVCLGTDSIVGVPPSQADRLSIVDEMRHLHRRDGTDPRLLLQMATINGCVALGLEPDLLTFGPGPLAGLIAIPLKEPEDANPLRQALVSDESIQTLAQGCS